MSLIMLCVIQQKERSTIITLEDIENVATQKSLLRL